MHIAAGKSHMEVARKTRHRRDLISDARHGLNGPHNCLTPCSWSQGLQLNVALDSKVFQGPSGWLLFNPNEAQMASAATQLSKLGFSTEKRWMSNDTFLSIAE
jgi:hypothetical protein